MSGFLINNKEILDRKYTSCILGFFIAPLIYIYFLSYINLILPNLVKSWFELTSFFTDSICSYYKACYYYSSELEANGYLDRVSPVRHYLVSILITPLPFVGYLLFNINGLVNFNYSRKLVFNNKLIKRENYWTWGGGLLALALLLFAFAIHPEEIDFPPHENELSFYQNYLYRSNKYLSIHSTVLSMALLSFIVSIQLFLIHFKLLESNETNA